MLAPKGIVKPILFPLLLLFHVLPAFSQKNSIRGIVTDTAEKKDLHYCIVALIDTRDSTLFRSTRTDEHGGFELAGIPGGTYTLLISYPRMADYLKDITVTATTKIDLGKIPMISKADLLAEVVVRAGVPIRMRGDTLEYTADSFAVRPGANVEELLKRLPGIQVEKNGKIYAQGKQVQKLLVDGDEFFSDDPVLATRYLQANAIDKVQVYDQKSEQAQFSGIDDGSRTKTINLKLKSDKKNGYFGKLSAGADGTGYYQHEAMAALFEGPMKMALFGLSFHTGGQDLLANELGNYVARDYEVIDDGTGSMGISTSGSSDASLSYYAAGIPSVMEGGGHYSNKWDNNRQKLFSNYRVNKVNSSSWSNGHSITVLPDGTGFNNTNANTGTTSSYAQKAGGSFVFPVDSFITVKLSVNGSKNDYDNRNEDQSSSKNEKGILVNNSVQSNSIAGGSRQFGTNLSYQQKFRKEGRTFSLAMQQDLNNNNHDDYNYSNVNYYDPASGTFTNSDTLNQLQRTANSFTSYAAKAVYTDKLNNNLRFAAEYGWKMAVSGNVFNSFNNQNGKFDARVDSLSNDYRFTANTHITGGLLAWNRKSVSLSAGGKIFLTQFRQVNNDLKTESIRDFTNFAPQFSLSFRVKQSGTVMIRYSGQTFQPSVEQLQPLHRSSSSQYVQIGNPNLKPGFQSNTSVFYYKYNFLKGVNYSINLSMSTSNAIGRLTSIDAQNRTTSQYININGIPNFYGFFRYSWEYKKIKLKPTLSLDAGSNGTYSIQNNQKLKNESRFVNGGLTLEHEWTNKLVTVYNGSINYEVGKSDISTIKTNIVIRHSHSITNSVYLSSKTELGSDCVFSFQPKNSSFSSDFNTVLWNAYLQRKFLKNDKGLVKLSVNDLLNTNTGYHRSVYGNNVSESDRLVVKRYFLLTLTWNFSKSGIKLNDDNHE